MAHREPEDLDSPNWWVETSRVRDTVTVARSSAPSVVSLQTVKRIREDLLPAYIRHRYGRRDALLAWLDGWRQFTLHEWAEAEGVTSRTILSWVEHFLEWIPGHMVSEQEEQELHIDDWAESFCDMSHRRRHKDGSTPPHGLENIRGQACIPCAARRA